MFFLLHIYIGRVFINKEILQYEPRSFDFCFKSPPITLSSGLPVFERLTLCPLPDNDETLHVRVGHE